MAREIESPATKGYWDKFYTEGSGVKHYEWYNIDVESLCQIMWKQQLLLANCIETRTCEVLQIGIGNSTLIEDLFQNAEYYVPIDVVKAYEWKIMNIDISEVAIEQCQEKVKHLEESKKSKQTSKTKTKSQTDQLKINETFQVMDACKMDFSNNIYDVVIDKGTIDALLCECNDEILKNGLNPKVEQLLKESYRVLKPRGRMFLFTGNDSSVVYPYVYHEELDWDVEAFQVPLNHRDNKDSSDFSNLNITLYVLTKPE